MERGNCVTLWEIWIYPDFCCGVSTVGKRMLKKLIRQKSAMANPDVRTELKLNVFLTR